MADREPRSSRKPAGDRPGGGRRDDEDAAVRALRQKLSGVLRRLPDIERQVVELRMGLADGIPAKPGEVAQRLGMSIAEVKRIEARAFSRIREVGPIKGLERFLER
jgi:DNA-directed RNA polymerase sigma subunit (sigma70/sigma32)